MQRLNKDTGQELSGVGNFLWETLLPRLFLGRSKTFPPIVGFLSTFTVKKFRLVLHNPVTQAAKKYAISVCANYELIGAVTGERRFSTADQIWAVKEYQRDGNKDQDESHDAKLSEIVSDQSAFKKRLFLHSNHMGSWLSIWVTKVIGTVPATTYFRDFYVHVINLTPLTSKGNATVYCRPFL